MKPEQVSATIVEDPVNPVARSEDELHDSEPVEADLLIEDVSIDGMCGVY